MNNFDTEIVHMSKLFTLHIWKTILIFFAALLIQLWNFRVFLFLKFFAKSINKETRRDYVSWGTIVEINPNTEISPTDGTCWKIMTIHQQFCKNQAWVPVSLCLSTFWWAKLPALYIHLFVFSGIPGHSLLFQDLILLNRYFFHHGLIELNR